MIRKATVSDIDKIIVIDTAARADPSRHDFIRRSVDKESCYVLTLDEGDAEEIAAYGVLDYSFFECGMIEMLMVAPHLRRQNLGSELICHMESECLTEKLFSSTNESNRPMQCLLAKLGYSPSGVIYNLDPGDPELVYFKQLPSS